MYGNAVGIEVSPLGSSLYVAGPAMVCRRKRGLMDGATRTATKLPDITHPGRLSQDP